MVESQIVILVVAGSNPVGHPIHSPAQLFRFSPSVLGDTVKILVTANEQFLVGDGE